MTYMNRILLVLNLVLTHRVREEKWEWLIIRGVGGPCYQLLAHAKIVITPISRGTSGGERRGVSFK